MKPEQYENSALVETWLKEPTWLEPVDTPRVADIVHRTPQTRRWSPHLDLGRFGLLYDAAKFVAASVILVLTGSLLLNTLPTEPTPAELGVAAPTATAELPTETATDPPVASGPRMPVITLPDDLPDGARSGTLDTPAGPARWVHLTGTGEGALPYPFMQVLPWGDGIASWDGYHGQLHVSDDGVTWERIDLWPSRGTAAIVGDTYVVVDAAGGRVMTSTDPEHEWVDLDASALAAAKLPGWKVGITHLSSAPVLADGRIVFTVQYRYSLPKEELNISKDGTKNLRALPDERYVLCSGGQRSSCGTDGKWVLRLKETPEGLVVRHDKTGKRLGLIAGATADEIYSGEHGSYRRAFMIDGDEVVEIDSPWPHLSRWQAADRTVAPYGTEPVVTRWLSDGIADPSQPGLPNIAAEVPKGSSLQVSRFSDRLAAHSIGPRSKTTGAWVSPDGVDWIPAPAGAPKDAEIQWTGSAWLARIENPPGADDWLHLGGAWVSLDDLGFEWAAEPRGVGNTTLFAGGSSSEEQELWVLTHPLGNKTE